MYLKVMVNGISRSQSMNDLRCLQRPKKVRLLPDEIMCLDITGMVLTYGDHQRIGISISGRQYEIGLGVDGIEIRSLNGKRRPEPGNISVTWGVS